MQILDNLIIISLIVSAFCFGTYMANRYNRRAAIEQKEALEKQFLRIKANADADDPVRPYGTPQVFHPLPRTTGDFDGDNNVRQIPPEFMDRLRDNKQASIKLKKSDIAK